VVGWRLRTGHVLDPAVVAVLGLRVDTGPRPVLGGADLIGAACPAAVIPPFLDRDLNLRPLDPQPGPATVLTW